MTCKKSELSALVSQARRLVIELAYSANKGHIGSALSIVDVAIAIAERIPPDLNSDPNRARFVLSKGHAATAWYAAQAVMGHISKSDVLSYGKNGTMFGTHPDPAQPGTDFMTGSLGQGIGFAVGCAFASRISGKKFKVFSILSDSELNEGSTWESLHIASHFKLEDLIVVLDLNGQQALGMTADVMNVGDIGSRLSGIGWNVVRVDGHDVAAISNAIDECEKSNQPNLIIAMTIAGYPISFMMRKVEWHYLPLTDDQYRQAINEIDDDSNPCGILR